jgi:two-component system, NtrC family, response regulator HydG
MSTKGKILIVDDELSVRDSLCRWFRDDGFEVATAEGANDALARMAEKSWDLALIDIRMRGTDGIELQRRIHEIDPSMLTIMMTGYASIDTAVTALKNGAYDYIMKPLDPDDVSHLVTNALAHRRTREENVRMRDVIESHAVRPSHIIGQSAVMQKVFHAIETVGPTDATVLITGESGTGKELVARAIHAASARRFHPMVAIHCGALTETLLESELFGHEKGAFTGAQYRKKGKFEMAEGGTVFLDEIGDISLRTQTDLLRVLQEREITRVGGHQPIKVDFRCVAATNKHLEQLIQEGKFRPDLYYRLNVFHIELPSLRERKEDLAILVDHFVKKYAQSMNRRIPRLTAEAMAAIQQYDWPGNVRELENAVERAMVVAHDGELGPQDLAIKQGYVSAPTGKTLEEIEKAHILRVLEECAFNQTRTADVLHIDRVTLHNRLKKYGWTRAPLEVR